MSERQFVRLHEINENEGATWTWWLEVGGNEEALGRLGELLRQAEDKDEAEDDFPYSYAPQDQEPESVVDKLVEYADENYYPSHNKVIGVFTCPDDLGDHQDVLYKGGIRDLFWASVS